MQKSCDIQNNTPRSHNLKRLPCRYVGQAKLCLFSYVSQRCESESLFFCISYSDNQN